LDGVIKALLPLAQAPRLAYPELVKSATIALLIGLLSHENADIVIDVVEVVHELTDEDVGGEEEDDEDQEGAADALKMLIEALVRFFDDDLTLLHILTASRSWKTRYWSFWLKI
jgi:beta-catenin-like protein 1